MKKNIIAVLLLLLVHANSLAQIPDVTGSEHTIIQSERQDGRFLRPMELSMQCSRT